MAYSPDGQSLATGSTDGTVRLWDPDTGHPSATLTRHGDPYISALVFRSRCLSESAGCVSAGQV
ncbi:WD40 repeat domain-containing protein [Streptomyces sp. NPDC005017]|uniref:WD40 repeat domain-containing protein n=1 Tax=Streptomyces sp. NPDC005017 TaxID=3364706 RepID=UPI0036C83EE1